MIRKVKLMEELEKIGIKNTREVFYNYGTPALYEQVIRRREGLLAHLGPLVVRTGYHTGRSPNDKFIVRESESEKNIWWGKVNKGMSSECAERIYFKMMAYIQGKDLYVEDCYAMKLAGITKYTESPDGGLIVKDPKTGEPTGVLKDNAMNFIYNIIPSATSQENYDAALAALEEAKSLGITSVQDITFEDALTTFQKIKEEGKLTCRIYTRWPISDYKNLVDKNINIGYGDDFIRMGSLKAFADGSLGSSTAWFFERYNQDTTTTGLPMDIITDGSMEKWGLDADKNHLQLSVHAIGDKANSYMLDLYEKIIKQNPKWDRRFRLEHAQHVRFEDIKRFAELGVIASVQPYHCIDDGVWAEKRIGPERIKYTYPFKSFLDAGVKMCFGTDWYVAPLNPLLGIYAAVTRRTLDNKNPDGWIPEQMISVEDAIKCYTINSAYASFEENIKGTIETGKLADLIILSDDILTIDPIKIKDAKVEMTMFDGKIIYNK